MPLAASKYKSLKEIVNEWSAQTGELHPVTLRRICDWAISGGFPDGTFVFPTGQAIDLLQLHRAMRIALGVGAPINPDLAVELLERTIVSKAGVDDYCERIGVDPPQGTRTLGSRFRQLFEKPRHLSPPDCPESAEIVARLEAGYSAVAAMNTMRSLVKQQRHPGHNVSEQAHERWLSYVNLAQPAAESSRDPEIQRELADLRREWENLKAISGAPGAVSPKSEENIDLEPVERKKRSVGRPQGSGSLEREDLELVEEMRESILSGKYPSIAAAARGVAPRAGGAGTLSSKEKRLSTRYAERYPD